MSANSNGIQRSDFAAIAEWVRPGSRVLDLGCGDGTLLKYLKSRLGVTGYGIEIVDDKVLACVRNGVNVIQGDLERGLAEFGDRSFDYVILSQTLQAVKNSERIIRVMRKAKGALPMTAAVQSMNPVVLKNIKRDNIKLETYRLIQRELAGHLHG